MPKNWNPQQITKDDQVLFYSFFITKIFMLKYIIHFDISQQKA